MAGIIGNMLAGAVGGAASAAEDVYSDQRKMQARFDYDRQMLELQQQKQMALAGYQHGLGEVSADNAQSRAKEMGVIEQANRVQNIGLQAGYSAQERAATDKAALERTREQTRAQIAAEDRRTARSDRREDARDERSRAENASREKIAQLRADADKAEAEAKAGASAVAQTRSLTAQSLIKEGEALLQAGDAENANKRFSAARSYLGGDKEAATAPDKQSFKPVNPLALARLEKNPEGDKDLFVKTHGQEAYDSAIAQFKAKSSGQPSDAPPSPSKRNGVVGSAVEGGLAPTQKASPEATKAAAPAGGYKGIAPTVTETKQMGRYGPSTSTAPNPEYSAKITFDLLDLAKNGNKDAQAFIRNVGGVAGISKNLEAAAAFLQGQ